MLRTRNVVGLVAFFVVPLLRFALSPSTVASLFDPDGGAVFHNPALSVITQRNAVYHRDSLHSETLVNEESFSACLLVMDDNHRLPEWIAYHYFAAKLRYLIVTSDPRSRTSPTTVLQRWKDRMTILELKDLDFADRNLTVGVHDTEDQRRYKHSQRQIQFYGACIRHLRQMNRTWTMFIDVDEFLTISGAKDVYQGHSIREPNSVWNVVKEFTTNASNSRSGRYPDAWYRHFRNGPCVTLGRALYSAVESTENEVRREVPSFLDAYRFDTLRWRYRVYPTDQNNGLGKSIIEVSRISSNDTRGGKNAHRPAHICPSAWIAFDTMPLGCNHYLGSWDSYMFREDARTTYKGKSRARVWRKTSGKQLGGTSDKIRPWLAEFVELVGKTAATSLLVGTGLPRTNQTYV